MKIFIICTVRNATQEYRKKLEDYVQKLEDDGHTVHLPHRDTKQDQSEMDICDQNMQAIKSSDEVHIFYNSDSQGTHFDMGMAFSSYKPIKVVEPVIKHTEGKSFINMLSSWERINN